MAGRQVINVARSNVVKKLALTELAVVTDNITLHRYYRGYINPNSGKYAKNPGGNSGYAGSISYGQNYGQTYEQNINGQKFGDQYGWSYGTCGQNYGNY